jgi:DNA-directed RNA polymerase alpha subunit
MTIETYDDDFPVSELWELSMRAKNRLERDYRTVGEVRAASDGELWRAPNFGYVSLKEVRELLGTSANPAPIDVHCIRDRDEWRAKERDRRANSPWYEFCL